jgi:uncharacterized protein with PQ loop repeat
MDIVIMLIQKEKILKNKKSERINDYMYECLLIIIYLFIFITVCINDKLCIF